MSPSHHFLRFTEQNNNSSWFGIPIVVYGNIAILGLTKMAATAKLFPFTHENTKRKHGWMNDESACFRGNIENFLVTTPEGLMLMSIPLWRIWKIPWFCRHQQRFPLGTTELWHRRNLCFTPFPYVRIFRQRF